MGHYFVLLRKIIKYNWEEGLQILATSTTSKVIFLSTVTNIDDFIDTVEILYEQIKKFEAHNPTLA